MFDIVELDMETGDLAEGTFLHSVPNAVRWLLLLPVSVIAGLGAGAIIKASNSNRLYFVTTEQKKAELAYARKQTPAIENLFNDLARLFQQHPHSGM